MKLDCSCFQNQDKMGTNKIKKGAHISTIDITLTYVSIWISRQLKFMKIILKLGIIDHLFN